MGPNLIELQFGDALCTWREFIRLGTSNFIRWKAKGAGKESREMRLRLVPAGEGIPTVNDENYEITYSIGYR